MRKIWDFHGGIHPPENKAQSTTQPIRFAGIPKRLVLPLQQHIGTGAKPLVAVGDQVLKGQLIAEAADRLCAPIHAPSSGTIVDIGDYPVPHPSGLTDTCIVIETDGQDQWIDRQPLANPEQNTPEELLAHIQAHGIVGLGGAGFPTSIKLASAQSKPIETLILNAAECEPYITADDMLMRERAEEVVRGLQIIARLLTPKECLIGIEDNKPEAIQALQAACTGTPIEVVVIPTKYPSGGEKQLIKILTGQEVPSGGLPADIGVVCQNVGTAVAVYRSVYHGEPLISRITTITGAAVSQPCNLEVLLGTPVEFLLDQCGFQASRSNRLVMGGPMMGFTLPSLELPIVKTSNCIMAVTPQELPPPAPALACIRCGLCAEACPAELLPQQLYWFSRSGELEKAEQFNLMDCIECGACSYVCPSNIPLVQYYRHAKAEVRREREEQEKANRARERFEQRQARQERELAEKEAKRKARAEAAAQAQAAKQSAVSAAPDKAAVIQAALERANAKKQAAATPAVDLATLEDNLKKAQAKLEKMRDMLAEARAGNSEQAEKLENAVRKNEERVRQAQEALEQARAAAATPPPATAGAEDIGQLERAVNRARNKVETIQQAVEAARAQDPERAEKLESSLQAAQAKLAEAEQALASAQQTSAATAPQAASLEELEQQLQKAEAKLAKMQQALDDARQNNPDNVEKLTRAVEKNQVRVDAARQALADARQQTSSNEAPAPSVEELKVQLAKAEDKLHKMEQALADAAPENVEKLTRAVEKNKVRVEAARQALAEAQQQVSAPEAPSVSLEELETQLAKAEDKLHKMEQALADAAPENVEKLTRAVEKNKVRVDAARQALEEARQRIAATSSGT